MSIIVWVFRSYRRLLNASDALVDAVFRYELFRQRALDGCQQVVELLERL